MTFDEWWDTTKTESTPETYKGWENSCRQAWAVAALAEQRRWEKALRLTWRMVDPFKPAGSPGSYARGQDSGIVAALTTLRENLEAQGREDAQVPALAGTGNDRALHAGRRGHRKGLDLCSPHRQHWRRRDE